MYPLNKHANASYFARIFSGILQHKFASIATHMYEFFIQYISITSKLSLQKINMLISIGIT